MFGPILDGLELGSVSARKLGFSARSACTASNGIVELTYTLSSSFRSPNSWVVPRETWGIQGTGSTPRYVEPYQILDFNCWAPEPRVPIWSHGPPMVPWSLGPPTVPWSQASHGSQERRYCIDTVSILYRYSINTVSIHYRYCIDTVSVLYRYCIDTVSI